MFLKTFRVLSDDDTPITTDLLLGTRKVDGEPMITAAFYQSEADGRPMATGLMNVMEAEMWVKALNKVIAFAKQEVLEGKPHVH